MNEIENLARRFCYDVTEVHVPTNGTTALADALVELIRAVVRDELGKASPQPAEPYDTRYRSCIRCGVQVGKPIDGAPGAVWDHATTCESRTRLYGGTDDESSYLPGDLPIHGCPACQRYNTHTGVCPVRTGELHLTVARNGVGVTHAPVWAGGTDGALEHCGVCGMVKP